MTVRVTSFRESLVLTVVMVTVTSPVLLGLASESPLTEVHPRLICDVPSVKAVSRSIASNTQLGGMTVGERTIGAEIATIPAVESQTTFLATVLE